MHDINVHIAKGECVGIIGPNGSGKTTLLNAMTGLATYAGRVEVNGVDLSSMSSKERSRLMASVPQRFSDGLDMRVESLVMMGRYPYLGLFSSYSAADMDAVQDAMEATDTLQFIGRRAYELSGGELQRIILARALAQQTPALLLDEATSGLDFSRSIEFFDLIRQRQQQGTTIVAVIHDLNLTPLYCDRILMLKDGKVFYDGSTNEVFTSEILSNVYDTEITIAQHPVTGSPQAFYMPDFCRNNR